MWAFCEIARHGQSAPFPPTTTKKPSFCVCPSCDYDNAFAASPNFFFHWNWKQGLHLELAQLGNNRVGRVLGPLVHPLNQTGRPISPTRTNLLILWNQTRPYCMVSVSFIQIDLGRRQITLLIRKFATTESVSAITHSPIYPKIQLKIQLRISPKT